jgi:hypothetical protein
VFVCLFQRPPNIIRSLDNRPSSNTTSVFATDLTATGGDGKQRSNNVRATGLSRNRHSKLAVEREKEKAVAHLIQLSSHRKEIQKLAMKRSEKVESTIECKLFGTCFLKNIQFGKSNSVSLHVPLQNVF